MKKILFILAGCFNLITMGDASQCGTSKITSKYCCDGSQPNCCNRRTNLCDRPYNKIVQIDVHNATTNNQTDLVIDLPVVGPKNVGPNPVADQHWTLKEMLDHGLRFFKFPIHPVGDDNRAMVTHTMSSSGIDDLAQKLANSLYEVDTSKPIPTSVMDPNNGGFGDMKPAFLNVLNNYLWQSDASHILFLAVLIQLKKFLDENPYEVITLELNTFDIDRLKPSLLKDFELSGINKYIYIPNNWPSPSPEWQSLGQMIKSNKRLVVLIDDEVDTPGFFNTSKYTTRNGFGFKQLDELTNGEDCEKVTNHDPNILFNMTHNLTGDLAGSTSLAAQANQSQVLRKHIQQCKAIAGRYPTDISMDFVNQNFEDTQNIIDEINSKDW